MYELKKDEFINLIQAVFPRLENDKSLIVLADIPENKEQDSEAWKKRRDIALNWRDTLTEAKSNLSLDSVQLVAYKNVGSNNADLPEDAYLIEGDIPDVSSELEEKGKKISFEKILAETNIFLAPTEYSTTAPMKMKAKKYGFRAATMSGFCENMIPSLQIDYNEVGKRTLIIKEKLDIAESAEAVFVLDDKEEKKVFFDLRFRKATPSSGRFPLSGTAGNLPSGETYIVPYEGELEEESKTNGELPVQFGEELVIYKIEKNKAVEAYGEGKALEQESELIKKEPAYANIAELGFGVLGDFGLSPIGETLLDEKLGFHVAFGRSDHFGGNVAPKDFSSPKAVVHIDRIYIKETQPRVLIKSLVLNYPDKNTEKIIENGNYLIFK